jgi:hypothetical protein
MTADALNGICAASAGHSITGTFFSAERDKTYSISAVTALDEHVHFHGNSKYQRVVNPRGTFTTFDDVVT